MGESEWENRVRKIKRGIGELRGKSQSERSARIKELVKEMRTMQDAEGVQGEPEWIKLKRERERKQREFALEARQTLSAIREAIDKETGRKWGNSLQVHSSLGFASMSFDVWYQTDQELERDRVSGRHAELTQTMKRVAKEIANAPSEVRFHSHQFVRERCDGDYFQYFR